MQFLVRGYDYLRSLRQRQNTVSIATIIILIGTLAAKIVGLLKINAIARVYGVSIDLDLFWAAFAIPDIIFNLIVVGSLNAALLPTFTKTRQNNPEEFNRLFSNVVTTYLLIVIIITALLFWLMPSLSSWLIHQTAFRTTQDLGNDLSILTADRLQTLVNLSQMLLVSPLILGLSAIIGAALQAHKRFIAVSIAPLAYNVGTLIGLMAFIILAPVLGIYALALSTLMGTVCHLFIQLPSLVNQGIQYNFYLNWSDKSFRRIIRLTVPRSLGLAVEQISIFFNTFWSFVLGAGALSTFKYATSLYLLPVHVVGNSIAQAVFPSLAEANQDKKSFSKIYFNALENIILWSLPLVAMTVILRVPIVRLIIGSERLTWPGTLLVAMVLALLAPAILFQAISSLNIRTFYAQHDTRSPFFISLLGVLMSIGASIVLSNFFSNYNAWRDVLQNGGSVSIDLIWHWFTSLGTSRMSVGGLALGISVGLFFELLLSFWLLGKNLDLASEYVQAMLKRFRNYFIIGACMAVVMYGSLKLLDLYLFDTSRTIQLALLTTIASLIGIAIYWFFAIRPHLVSLKIANRDETGLTATPPETTTVQR